VVKEEVLKPLGNRVLVEPLVEQAMTSGGIVLPDTAKKKPLEGKVLAVGEGERLESGEIVPPPVKKGNIVIYPEFSGTEIRVGNKDLLVIEVDSLLAVKEPDKKPAPAKVAKKKAAKKR